MSEHDEPNVASPHRDIQQVDDKHGLEEVERTFSPDLDKGNQQRYDKVDKELAKYVADEAFEISEEENSRLRRLIDKRVLAIMITTYFIQAIDKGTLSFSSIMGIREDTGLHGQQVCPYSRLVLKPLSLSCDRCH